jgi:hypothetical protein
MACFPCPYLKGEVELTPEREEHIGERHPDLLPKHRRRIGETLADPDQVRRSVRLASAHLFSRWFDNIKGGKQVVVVVVSEATGRHWVVTAYMARKLAEGVVEWQRN